MRKHTGWGLMNPQGKIERYADNPHAKSKLINQIEEGSEIKRGGYIHKLYRNGFKMVKVRKSGSFMAVMS